MGSANSLQSKGSSWCQQVGIEGMNREITEGYRGYMQFDIAFVSWVDVLLDLLSLSNFLSLDPVPRKTKIICFWFQMMKNHWVWRKFFGRFITILIVSSDIVV